MKGYAPLLWTVLFTAIACGIAQAQQMAPAPVAQTPQLGQNGPSPPIYSPPAPANFVMRGIGTSSCGQFVAAEQKLPLGKVVVYRSPEGQQYYGLTEVYAEWIQGYISGVNSMINPAVNQINVDYTGVELWIREWCVANPAENIAAAAAAFARSRLMPRTTIVEPQPSSVSPRPSTIQPTENRQ